MAAPGTDQDLVTYLSSRMVLIVEPSKSFSTTITVVLTNLGMPAEKIYCVRTYNDAVRAITEQKPHILITEYLIGRFFGLGLIEKHEQNHDELARISMIVTSESSDSAVAEAAEEQVDTYMLKPFSGMDFQKRFLEVIRRKMQPGPYTLKIREGKALLSQNKIEEAMSIFEHAKKLSEKPTSAFYHVGNCHYLCGRSDLARREFSEGRKFQSLHYKCLTGEFECFMDEKNYTEAYKLVSLIRESFPVTSTRLGKFFIATVYTSNFQDLPKLYELYTGLDIRTPELISLVSMALFTAGKFFLRGPKPQDAIEYLEMGATVASRNIDYLDKIIDELIKVKEISAAEGFLKRIPADQIKHTKAIQMRFKVDRFTLPTEKVIEIGRKMVSEGQFNPEIAKIIIKLAVDAKKMTLAESIISKTLQSYPDLRQELYLMLDSNTES